MLNINEIILSLLRRALWDCPIALPADIDWPTVYAELKSQVVSSLTDNLLMEYCSDPALKRTWAMEILHQLNHNENNIYEQDLLLKLLKENGIPTAIMKGTAAARYYPRPESRILGDVDFLVPVDEFERTLELLKANGYNQLSKLKEGYCEVLLEKGRVFFELHRGVNSTNGISVAAVNSFALDGLRHAEQHCINGYTFPALPEPANGLVLLSHIRQHLNEGLGLRQIIDWMMYVHHTLNDAAWHHSFQPAAKQCGLETLAITVTRMCQIYLGLPNDITWCCAADETVCSLLMDYILEGGNFGQKIERSSLATQSTMMQKNYLWKMLISLQSKGRGKMVVKKHPALRPFAWAVQIAYYTRHTFKRGNVVQALREDAKKAQHIQNLLEELGIHAE